MKKLKSVLLPIALVSLLFAGCQPAAQQEEEKEVNDKYMSATFVVGSLKEKKVSFYFGDSETPVTEVPEFEKVYIPVNQSTGEEIVEIPYVNVAEWLTGLNYLLFGSSYKAKTEPISPTQVKIYRTQENSFGVTFDSQAQTVYFQDFDAANRRSDKDALISVASISSSRYLQNTGNNFNRYGKYLTVDLGKYGIQMVIQDENVYLPLTTFNTLFARLAALAYNKSGIFLQHTANSKQFFDENSGKGDRSEDLIAFNYRDLCFAMDFLYGLKESHGITNFHEYFFETGLVEKFFGTAYQSSTALYDLTSNYFADHHSGLSTMSYYSEGGADPHDAINSADLSINPVKKNENQRDAYYESIRDSVWTTKSYVPHLSPISGDVYDYCVNEAGDTAFITFDHFSFPRGVKNGVQTDDYFALTNNGESELDYEKVSDTVGLVIYAHQQIKKNPNIKNVVIDDSLNGGGTADALLYVLSWVLGETPFSIKNIVSGGMCTASYMADVDLDGEFEEEDSLQGLKTEDGKPREINIFCVTTGASFSCGNGLPAALKESGMVTILGMKSGGGACVVRKGYSADGADYQISGQLQLCTVKNGSYYQIDQGVEPDYSITDLRNVYNRETLASFIKNRVIYSSGSRIRHE